MAPPQLDDAPTGLIPNILCKQYHAAQRDGFDVLFRGEQWAVWACRQYPVNAREYSRSLASSEVETIIAKLKTCVRPRQKAQGIARTNSGKCGWDAEVGHVFMIRVLKQTICALTSNMQPQNEQPEEALEAPTPYIDGTSDLVLTDPFISFADIGLTEFLGAVEGFIEQLCNVWDICETGCDISAAGSIFVWIFRELRSTLWQTFLRNPEWFHKVRTAKCLAAWPSLLRVLKVSERTLLELWRGGNNVEVAYLKKIINVAFKADRGSIYLVHDLIELLPALMDKSTLPFNTFAGSIFVHILLQLKISWQDERLSCQKDKLSERQIQLKAVCGDLAAVDNKCAVADTALDITTLGCLSIWIEANLQNLLQETLGQPLVTAAVHLYVYHRLRGETKTDPRLDRLCEKFAKLLFWDGVPKDITSCQESVRHWILDINCRSLQTNFTKQQFDKRKLRLTSRLCRLYGGSYPRLETNSCDFGPVVMELREDRRHAAAIYALLVALEEAIGLESTADESARGEAFRLTVRILTAKGETRILQRVLERY